MGELKYGSIKKKILQIFSGATSGADTTPDVEVEPNNIFYSLSNCRPKNKDQQESSSRGGNQSYHRGDRGSRQFSDNSLGNWNSKNNYNGERHVKPSKEHGNPLSTTSVNLFYFFPTCVNIKQIIPK